METKKCRVCQEEKLLSEYYKHKNSKDGYRNDCINCRKIYNHHYAVNHKNDIKEYKSQYRKNNIEKIKVGRKEHYQNNKNKILEYQKQYRESNKNKIREYKLHYFRNLRANDLLYCLLKKLQRRIRHALKNDSKSAHTKELIGCSPEFLQIWLNSTIEELNNKLTIDHIRPCASYNLSNPKEQRECFNWKNLRLISQLENSSKNNRREPILEAQYIIKAQQFEDLYNTPLY